MVLGLVQRVLVGGVALLVLGLGMSTGVEDMGDRYRDLVSDLLRNGEVDEAGVEIGAWREAVPGDYRADLAAAELAARRGDLATAIRLLRQVLAVQPSSAAVLLRLADLLEETGAMEEAIAACREAVERAPADRSAVVRLGDLYRMHGDLDAAATLLESRMQEDTAGDFALRHALAAVRYGQARFSEVVDLLARREGDPRFPIHARQLLAAGYGEAGMVGEAVEEWAGLLVEDPWFVEGYYRLGQLLRRQGKVLESKAVLDIYSGLGWYKEGGEEARKLVLSGKPREAHLLLAGLYDRALRFDLALEEYASAVRAGPNEMETYSAAFLFCLDHDLLPEARDWLDRAMLRRDLPVYWTGTLRGLLRERVGDLDGAAGLLAEALEARPGFPPAKQAAERVRRKQAGGGASRLDEMRAEILGGGDVRRGALYVELATLAEGSGKGELERDYLSAALYLDPGNDRALARLAEAMGASRELFLRLHLLNRLVDVVDEPEPWTAQIRELRKGLGLE